MEALQGCGWSRRQLTRERRGQNKAESTDPRLGIGHPAMTATGGLALSGDLRKGCVHALAGGQEHLKPGPPQAPRGGERGARLQLYQLGCLLAAGNRKPHQQWLELQTT